MEGADPAVRAVVAACGAAPAPTLGPAAHGPSPLQRSGPAGRPWPLGAAVLAARPEGAPLAAVQQLLAKGLFHPSTHQLTLQATTARQNQDLLCSMFDAPCHVNTCVFQLDLSCVTYTMRCAHTCAICLFWGAPLSLM